MDNDQKVSILLAEYNTLRAEVLAARTNVMQAFGIATAVLMGVVGIRVSQGFSGHEWIPWTISPMVIAYLGATYIWNDLNTESFTRRLRALEAKINELADDTLLVWETDSGWGSIGPSRLKIAFIVGLIITAVGAIGICTPNGLVWFARRFVSPTELASVAAFRVLFGLLLITVSSASRAPKTLRAVASVPIISGVATLFLVQRVPALIDSWIQQGSGLVRLMGLVLLALGGFVAYACAPSRRLG